MPMRVANFVAKTELGRANKMQEKFRRNGKAVERERILGVVATMKERRGKPLMDDQAAVFERCEELFEDARGEGERLQGRERAQI